MSHQVRASAAPFKTETVWNAGLAGTGMAGEGQSLLVGHDGDWAPEHLLLLAAESCFMSTLLGLAAASGVEVLGYVSNGQLQLADQARSPGLVSLSPCVVVASAADAERVSRLGEQARRESVVALTLGDRLTVSLDVRLIPSSVSG